jgi:hypothetical protein
MINVDQAQIFLQTTYIWLGGYESSLVIALVEDPAKVRLSMFKLFKCNCNHTFYYTSKKTKFGGGGVYRSHPVVSWSVGRSRRPLHFPCTEHNLKTNGWNSI